VDAQRQIIVDWRVIEYWILKVPPLWNLRGMARMWSVIRQSGSTQALITPISETYEIVTTGETIEGAARTLMSAAWEQCIEGKPPTGTEH
jgi:hypothetical protein